MTQHKEGDEVSVRLLIHSGRPDPEWSLNADEARELVELLTASVGAQRAHPPQAGGLGYRGFLIRDAPVGDRAGEIAVFSGVVTERPGPQAVHWRDPRGVERWLIEQARRQGHGPVLDAEGVGSEGAT